MAETRSKAQVKESSTKEMDDIIGAKFSSMKEKMESDFIKILDKNNQETKELLKTNVKEIFEASRERLNKQIAEVFNAIHFLAINKNATTDQESGQSSMSQPLFSATQPVLPTTQPVLPTTQPVLSAAQQVLTTAHPMSQPFLSVTQPVSSTAQQDLSTAQPLLPNRRQLQFHPQEIRPTCNRHQDSSPDLWRADGPLLLCLEERYRPWPRTAIGPAALQCSEHLRVAEDPSQLPPPRGPERCDGEPAGNYTGLTRLAKLEFPRFDGAQVEEWIFKTEQFFKIDTTPNHLKVSISSIHLDGKEATWHQATLQTDPEVVHDWDRYRTLLIERFGELTEAPIAEFDHGRKIYDHVFGSNIEAALSNEETWKNRKRPRPIYSKGVLPESLTQQNGSTQNCSVTDGDSMVSVMPTLGLKNPQELWDLSQNSLVFIEALKLFFAKRKKEIGHLTFDKDDQLAVEFVTAAATTNAIIAGLIVIEAIKVLKKDENKYRMTYCLEHPSKKMVLMPIEPYEPNPAFYVTESSSGSETASKKRRLSEIEPSNHKKKTENVESETENVESEDDDIMEVENPMMEWLVARP